MSEWLAKHSRPSRLQALYKLTAAHLGVFMIGTYVVEQVIGMYALNPTI